LHDREEHEIRHDRLLYPQVEQIMARQEYLTVKREIFRVLEAFRSTRGQSICRIPLTRSGQFDKDECILSVRTMKQTVLLALGLQCARPSTSSSAA
jgi:hypothetical protein